ncbi:MAG TPA: Gfo/Idh/MocA family oxidoreductase [Caldilineaceae bacterium]|nr:Gfo/Idh/MocA family oxidoreductase [Caldilineaceae bacterium]
MSNQPITIGMMSFAHGHAYSYANCLQTIAGVTLAGIYDDNAERGRQAADRYGVPFFAGADELLTEHLDGVIICSENAKHRSMVEAAAGKVAHILCEKPIASTAEDGQAIIDVCAATNTKLQIAFPVRFAPTVQWLKEQVNSGDLGKIYAVQTTNHGSMPGGWFVDKELSGGGAVIDHTVHVIDLLRWFWSTEVTEVYAEVGQELLHPGLGIDDVGMLSFTLANGIYGTLDTSWSRSPSYPTWGDVKIEVTAEKGVIFVDAFRQHLAVSSNKTGKTQWMGWGSNMDLGLVRDFVEMMRNGSEPSISGRDGLAALEVALAAYRSAELGEAVALA